jgi:hypothetical protein
MFLHCLNLPFSLSYGLCLVPSYKAPQSRCILDLVGESHDCFNPFQPSSFSKFWCRPLFSTFQAPRQGFIILTALICWTSYICSFAWCGSRLFCLLCMPRGLLPLPVVLLG